MPYNVTIGRGGVLVDAKQGIATVTIVKSPKEEGIYGIPPVGQWQGALKALKISRQLSTLQLFAIPPVDHWQRSAKHP